MASDLATSEAAAWGVAVMARYGGGPRAASDRAWMAAAARGLAEWAVTSGLDDEATRAGVLEPVLAGILARFPGAEAGVLFGEFVEAFEAGRVAASRDRRDRAEGARRPPHRGSSRRRSGRDPAHRHGRLLEPRR